MGWLVVAGETSGDRIAAAGVRALDDRKAGAWGVGGPACRDAGVEIVAATSDLAAMGIGDVVRRAPAIARALVSVWRRVRGEPPDAALLVNFSELSARLGPRLRAHGVPVLWCVAPQVWAWRPGRAKTLAGAMDRLAVILPFEEALWRRAGVDATFIGHPSVEVARPDQRDAARTTLGLDPGELAIGVLPGSRSGEISRLAAPLAEAAALFRRRHGGAAILVEAQGLAIGSRRSLAEIGRRHDLRIVRADAEHGAAPLLAAFDVTLCASGTASLESALAGAPPVVAYRLDRIAHAIARRMVTIDHIALPNVLLERRAFAEVLQDEVSPDRLAREAEVWLGRGDQARAIADVLRDRLTPAGPRTTFGARLASLLASFLPRRTSR